MRETTCCFTGHRDIFPPISEHLKNLVTQEVTKLIENGVDTFICGGAVGFDTLCAFCIIKLKETYKNIKLVLFLPHQNQDRFYNEKNKAFYEHIKHNADKIIYTSKYYSSGCLHFRNRCMVDNSKYVIAYCTKNYGGSYYTKEYAKLNNVTVINLAGSDA